jgi:hypothetical protein
MYVPKSDQVTDIATLQRFISDYSFVTIISLVEARICGTRVQCYSIHHVAGPVP